MPLKLRCANEQGRPQTTNALPCAHGRIECGNLGASRRAAWIDILQPWKSAGVWVDFLLQAECGCPE
jgi:hypothetical protein